MSRIGKKPIFIPSGVHVLINGQSVQVNGPKGSLTLRLHPSVFAHVLEDDKTVEVTVQNEEEKSDRAQWGTARSLIANMIEGVTNGFIKKLEVNGVGYRVNLSGNTLVLNVGFSHDVKFTLPEGVQAAVEGNTVTFTGFDRQLVGEAAARLRRIRRPEPYKGKGIKYAGEIIRRKAGKSQKASA